MTTSVHVERVAIGTTDPERAHDTLSTMYADHTPRLYGSRERFRFRIAGAGTGLLRIDDVAHSMAVDSRQDAHYDALIAVELLGGRIDFANGRSTIAPSQGDILLGDPIRPNRVHWSDVTVRTTRLDLAAARRVVEELTASRPRASTSNCPNRSVRPRPGTAAPSSPTSPATCSRTTS